MIIIYILKRNQYDIKFIFANNLVNRLIVLPHVVLTYDKTILTILRLSSSLKYAKHYSFW